MKYSDMLFKIPRENHDYSECSEFVVEQIEAILSKAIVSGNNKIVINTNLRLGLPMENINKIAGPFVEAWAFEIFHDISKDLNNQFRLINVEAQERLYMADIILQFRKTRKIGAAAIDSSVTAEVDVKATAEDLENSGKSPNITSFARIRTAYVEDPDYIFIILSLKHRVYSARNGQTGLMDGIMEVVGHNTYDLKYLSANDVSYNPALGTGQIQVRDIHYIALQSRTTWEFCQMLDEKYLKSKKRTFADWLHLAKKNGWIKSDD